MNKWIFPALVFSLGACAAAPEQTATDAALDGDWQITEIGGEAAKGSLSFASSEHGFSANVGCNTFFGEYQADDKTLRFSEPAASLMACEAHLMQLDEKLTQSFAQSSHWQYTGETLEIRNRQGQILIKATR